MHGIICWRKTIHIFVPRRGTGEYQLNRHTDNIEISKCPRIGWYYPRRPEYEHHSRPDKWSSEVQDSIWKPCEQIKDPVLMRGEDIAEIGAVEYVLQGRKHLHPDVWSVFRWNESSIEEEEQPSKYRQDW